jgi:hypothetical protein
MNTEEVSRDYGCCLPVAHLEELLPQLKVIFVVNCAEYITQFFDSVACKILNRMSGSISAEQSN